MFILAFTLVPSLLIECEILCVYQSEMGVFVFIGFVVIHLVKKHLCKPSPAFSKVQCVRIRRLQVIVSQRKYLFSNHKRATVYKPSYTQKATKEWILIYSHELRGKIFIFFDYDPF